MCDSNREVQQVKLSPSAWEIWSNCTAQPLAVAAEKASGVLPPDTSSPYADEGIAAHEVFATSVLLGVSPREFVGTEMSISGLNRGWLVDEEMGEELDKAFEYVRDHVPPAAPMWVEQKVEIGKALPGSTGILDLSALVGKTLHVFDLKYGKGIPVYAKDNGQISLYALGAFDNLLDIEGRIGLEEVVVHIVQPRLNNFSNHRMSKGDLERFRLRVRNTYVTVTDPEKAEFKPGEHCRFCPRLPYCTNLRETIYRMVFEVEPTSFHDLKSPERMTSEELATMYPLLDFISAWTSNVRKYMEAQALRGTEYPGLKVVEGRKGARAWKDESIAIETLVEKGVTEEKLYKKTLISPAQAETVIGRKNFGPFREIIVQTEGKPTLVPVEDPRPTMVETLIGEFDDE